MDEGKTKEILRDILRDNDNSTKRLRNFLAGVSDNADRLVKLTKEGVQTLDWIGTPRFVDFGNEQSRYNGRFSLLIGCLLEDLTRCGDSIKELRYLHSEYLTALRGLL